MLTKRKTVLRMKTGTMLLSMCLVLITTTVYAQNVNKNDPRAMVAGVSGGVTTIDQILANPILTSTLPDSKVASFTVTLIPKDTFIVGPFKTEGSALSPRVIDLLTSVRSRATSIVFEDIIVTKDGKNIQVPTLFIKCKQK